MLPGLRPLRLSSASSLPLVVSLTLISWWFLAPSSDSRAVSGGGLWLGSSGRAGQGRAACWCCSQGADPVALLAGPGRRALSLLQKVRGNFSHYSANPTDERHFILRGGGGSLVFCLLFCIVSLSVFLWRETEKIENQEPKIPVNVKSRYEVTVSLI